MEAAIYKDITAKEFKELDFNSVTLVDLFQRELMTYRRISRYTYIAVREASAKRLPRYLLTEDMRLITSKTDTKNTENRLRV